MSCRKRTSGIGFYLFLKFFILGCILNIFPKTGKILLRFIIKHTDKIGEDTL